MPLFSLYSYLISYIVYYIIMSPKYVLFKSPKYVLNWPKNVLN